jgi:two-component system phosphate regulon sensor histidine kinase PhoR
VGRKRLLWQIFPSYILITVISLMAVGWYTSHSVRQFYLNSTRSDLEARARLVKSQIETPIPPRDFERVDELCKSLGLRSGTRITIVLVDGRVIGDTDETPERMENHGDRPEIRAALANGAGSSTRYSTTLETNMMYVAIPVLDGSQPVGVVRTAIPVTAIDDALGQIYGKILLGGLIVALLAALVSLMISRRISRPLEALKQGVQRFAEGDLGRPLPPSDSEEIGALSDAMNAMAIQLDDRIRRTEQQKNQEAAVLRSMSESLFAVDADERLIRVNAAATRLFDIDDTESLGKPIHEVVRNHDLLQLVGQVLQSEHAVEGEITLDTPEERHLQVHGTVLRGANGSRFGALLVLNDVTRLRRLERVRRDFVANVSHELRTPITTIKGFVETLQGGALANRKDAERFLDIIANHTERLNAIIEDLLALSWLEQDTDQEIVREIGKLEPVVARAVEAWAPIARTRDISIVVRDPHAVTAAINPPLIERALVNLIDNAIKYSDPGSKVEIALERDPSECRILVADRGAGIEKRHLPRIFERFYRTDKARSRSQGGTGLGLAIVKHIALLHSGSVSVESQLGEGSTFTIRIPD